MARAKPLMPHTQRKLAEFVKENGEFFANYVERHMQQPSLPGMPMDPDMDAIAQFVDELREWWHILDHAPCRHDVDLTKTAARYYVWHREGGLPENA